MPYTPTLATLGYVMSPDGREAVLNIIQQGEVFGEIALLDGRPRTADATSMSDNKRG